MPYQALGRLQERRPKIGAAAMLAAAPGVRLRCRSGPRTSGRERRGEGLGGRSAVLADGRQTRAVRDVERRMIEGCFREAHPLIGGGLEEGHQVRLVAVTQAEIPDAGIEIVDVRLVEVPTPGIE